MKKYKVGIIGAGMAFERLHYPAFQALADRYEITALCDIDRQKALRFAKTLNLQEKDVFTDYSEMIWKMKPDIADIIVPIELNFEITREVAEQWSGQEKAIICEKPLASNFDEALRARNLAKEYSVPIMIAENYRYNQEIDMIRDLVRTKKVGDIYYFVQNRVVDFPKDMLKDKFPAKEWRQYPEYPGGVFTDTGIHDISGLQHMFGAVKKVQAFGRPQNAEFAPYSVISANMEFENGIIGQFSFFCTGKEMQRPLIGLRVLGTEGMIYLEERDCGTINLAFNNGRSEQISYEVQKGFYNELINFYNSLTGKEQISVTPEVEFGDFRVVMCILASIREERIISIDDEIPYETSIREKFTEYELH